MKFLLFVILSTGFAYSAMKKPELVTLSVTGLKLSKSILNNSNLEFISHHDPGPFGKALAMNIHFEPIDKLRTEIERALGVKLKKFTGWNINGEAHITTITPPEYANVFSTYITIQEIDAIAQSQGIQNSDLTVEGIGSGSKQILGSLEETYFLIVKSEKLINIRKEINKLYLSRGGSSKSFNPEHFYPHITIGFTSKDLHEADGVIKDKEHSLDRRFSFEWIAN